MKKVIVIIFIIFLVFTFISCENKTVDNKIIITVSIPTLKYILGELIGDSIHINIAIPQGYSPENYSPSPREVEDISNSTIYFSLGLPTEKSSILEKAQSLNKDLEIIHLDEYVDSINPVRMFNEQEHIDENDQYHSGRDPHIWLSPSRIDTIIEKMYTEIDKLNTIDKEILLNNKNILLDKNKKLDLKLKEILKDSQGKTFIVYHPSLGYFADEYNIKMKEIQVDGKEAYAKYLEEIIDFAKVNNIHNILYQKEYDSTQPKTIAKEIGGKALPYRPLGENYFEIMEEIANLIKEAVGK